MLGTEKTYVVNKKNLHLSYSWIKFWRDAKKWREEVIQNESNISMAFITYPSNQITLAKTIIIYAH